METEIPDIFFSKYSLEEAGHIKKESICKRKKAKNCNPSDDGSMKLNKYESGYYVSKNIYNSNFLPLFHGLVLYVAIESPSIKLQLQKP